MRILTCLLIVPLLSCSSTTAPEPGLGNEFTVAIDSEVVLSDIGLRIEFLDVTDDSRCPSTVTCVWEGDGAVVLATRFLTDPPVRDTLHTTLEPNTVIRDGIEIRFVRLDPYPELDPIARSLYSAVLTVRAVND